MSEPSPAPRRPVLTLKARAQLILLLQLGAIGRDLGVTPQDHAGLTPQGVLATQGLDGSAPKPPPLRANQMRALQALEAAGHPGELALTEKAWRRLLALQGGPPCPFQPAAAEIRGLVQAIPASVDGQVVSFWRLTRAGRQALHSQPATAAADA